MLGTRDPDAADVVALATETGATTARPEAAVSGADLVILALPWGAAEGVVGGLGPMAGKLVIDCMNPLGMVNGAFGLTVGHSTSAARLFRAGCRRRMWSRP